VLDVGISFRHVFSTSLLSLLEVIRVLVMSLESDLTIDASKFDRKIADKQTEEFNEKLIKIWADGPRWYEV